MPASSGRHFPALLSSETFHLSVQIPFRNQFPTPSHYSCLKRTGMVSLWMRLTPHLHFCAGQRRVEGVTSPDWAKTTGATTGACAELPLQPPTASPVPLHQIRQFWGSFSRGERAEGVPQEAGGEQGPWATSVAAEGCSIGPAAVWIKTSTETGKCSSARDRTSFLTAPLWILTILLHLRAQFND